MRFVAYCSNGHLNDIDWFLFAHLDSQNPSPSIETTPAEPVEGQEPEAGEAEG